jgi:glycyl-tRNA synthetase beta chain
VEGLSIGHEVDERLLTEDAEVKLYQTMKAVLPQSAKSFEAKDYAQSLKTLAQLKESVDLFFEKVMVNAPDEALRLNRLSLLSRLHGAMNQVADLSRLAQ